MKKIFESREGLPSFDPAELLDFEKAPWPGEDIELKNEDVKSEKTKLLICPRCFRVYAKYAEGINYIKFLQEQRIPGVWDFRSKEYSIKFSKEPCGECGWGCMISFMP